MVAHFFAYTAKPEWLDGLGLWENELGQEHCGSHEVLWVQKQQEQQEGHHC